MPEVSIAELADGCPDCLNDYMQHPFLMEAWASVGIEHGKSTADMARDWFRQFHKRGHRLDG